MQFENLLLWIDATKIYDKTTWSEFKLISVRLNINLNYGSNRTDANAIAYEVVWLIPTT